MFLLFSLPMFLNQVSSLSLIILSCLTFYGFTYNTKFLFLNDKIIKKIQLLIIPIYIKTYDIKDLNNFSLEIFKKNNSKDIDHYNFKNTFVKMAFNTEKENIIIVYPYKGVLNEDILKEVSAFYKVEFKQINL